MPRKPFADLTAQELAMLGHSLRMVPSNACLTGNALKQQDAGKGVAMFHEIAAFKSLWDKTAKAINDRADMAPFRTSPSDAD